MTGENRAELAREAAEFHLPRYRELQKQLNEQENKIHRLWHGLFHEEKSNLPKTPTQRIMAMATTGMGIIDGAILGWKLYRKFRK